MSDNTLFRTRELNRLLCALVLVASCRANPGTDPTPRTSWQPLESQPAIAEREEHRRLAYQNLDSLGLAALLAPTYMAVSSEQGGRFGDKTGATVAVRNHILNEPSMDSIRVDSMRVRLQGNVAYVVGWEHMYMTDRKPRPPLAPGRIEAHDIFSDTWENQNGVWLIAVAQHTVIRVKRTPLP